MPEADAAATAAADDAANADHAQVRPWLAQTMVLACRQQKHLHLVMDVRLQAQADESASEQPTGGSAS